MDPRRFSLAAVLADAVGDVRHDAAARDVPVLVDLVTPIEAFGPRDPLLRAIIAVLRGAVAATRPGGSVVARARILARGRARIDVHDDCGGGAAIDFPARGDANPCCGGAATGR